MAGWRARRGRHTCLADLRGRKISAAALVPTALFLLAASITSPPNPDRRLGPRLVPAATPGRWKTTPPTLEREREQLDQLAAKRERTAIARLIEAVHVVHAGEALLSSVNRRLSEESLLALGAEDA
ncbi:hypothetical protein [Spirillospora sp. NPDC047279]|uniref:hypothetical protein n=1 Tax=Spirillospora sp. NPDC047279 TaxID=3155478 RepID=UPI0033E4A375